MESQTCLLRGEGEGHDVIEGPAVADVGRVEGQGAAGGAAEIQQEGGVHHGNREAAGALPLADGDVVCSAIVVALGKEAAKQIV